MSGTRTRAPSRLGGRPRWFCWGITEMSLGITAAAQQSGQSEQLQQQVGELKQEYQATTQGMSLRIAALEQLIENEKEADAQNKTRTVSTAELAAKQAAGKILSGESDDVGPNFKASSLPHRPMTSFEMPIEG